MTNALITQKWSTWVKNGIFAGGERLFSLDFIWFFTAILFGVALLALVQLFWTKPGDQSPGHWEESDAVTNQQDKLDAVHHVVHEYANLVSSGTIVIEGKHRGKPLEPPLNTHVQHAFLLNCRKLADFFSCNKKQDDVTACDFLGRQRNPFTLAEWPKWKRAINKQLTHITNERHRSPKRWTGEANPPLLKEFQAAWRTFMGILPQPYKAEFEKQIDEKLESEFKGLDLR